MIEETVPKAKVRQIAEQFHKLVELRDQQAAVQAQLIRWCLMALRQTTEQAQRRIENQCGKPYRRVSALEASRRVRQDRHAALAYLGWLADKLEGKDVPPSPISSDDLTQSTEGGDDVRRGDSTS